MLKLSIDDGVVHRILTDTMSKMKRKRKIKIINLAKLSAIASHNLMLVVLMISISHTIVLKRKVKPNTMMRILVLLSNWVRCRSTKCNFNARTVYTMKQKRFTARKIKYVSLKG